MIAATSLSMEVFVATTSFFGVNVKICGLKSGSKLFLVSNGKIKLRIEPEEAVSRISLVQDLQKLLPDYKFQSD